MRWLAVLIAGCSVAPTAGDAASPDLGVVDGASSTPDLTDLFVADFLAPDLAGPIACVGGSASITCGSGQICELIWPGARPDLSAWTGDSGCLFPPSPKCIDVPMGCGGAPTCGCVPCDECPCEQVSSRTFRCPCL